MTVAETKASNARYRGLLDASPDPTIVVNPAGDILLLNAQAAKQFGYHRRELLGRPIKDLIPTGYAERLVADGLRSAAQARTQDMGSGLELVGLRKDGTSFPLEMLLSPLESATGVLVTAVIRDITARKAGERVLVEMDARYQGLLEAAPDAMVVVNHAGDIVLLNVQAERQFGYGRNELVGTAVSKLIPIGYAERLVADALRSSEAALAQQIGTGIELIARRKDGSEFPIELMLSPLGSAEGILVTAAIRDISDRKAAALVLAAMESRYEAERDLHRSEERFRRLFDSNIIGITIADLTGRTLEANDAYLQLLGYSRDELLAVAIDWDAVTPPDVQADTTRAVEQLLATGVSAPRESAYVRKDGSHVPVLVGVALLDASEGTCLTYIVDLSNRRLLEEQLRRAQRLEAVGQLAGGIAHDFNNLLTVILGHANLLVDELPEGDPARDSVMEIRDAGDRAAAMTRQLLAFSGRQVLAPGAVDLGELVTDIETLLRRTIGEHIELFTDLRPGIARVLADRGQIEQVLMNLVVNARDAMPMGGTLSIAVGEVVVPADGHPAGLVPGRYATLAVDDSGTGMDPETRAHIFEPFYTTKEVGKGTGLGLATSYGFVQQSGGSITVDSQLGEGSTVTVYLPSTDAQATAHVAPTREPGVPAVRPTETVLLVDDNAAVRRVTARILERCGYVVIAASDGLEALARAHSHPGPIDVLLTDVVMPNMRGPDLAGRFLADRPGTPVVFMSGYSQGSGSDADVGPTSALVHKPFTADDLIAALRRALPAELTTTVRNATPHRPDSGPQVSPPCRSRIGGRRRHRAPA
ncbi:MAG: PAS domain S-box protein [Chloroflexi bacterium]|nr:PAS domain S-box protein [Chloroflexota bacterium]